MAQASPDPKPQKLLDSAVPCWQQIGTYGTRTCPELPRFVQCRNCPIYTGAGLELLKRPPSEELRQEWTNHFATQKPPPSAGKLSVIIFHIGSEWLAISTEWLQEVSERRRIHSLPHRREGMVLGLVNIRGELLICVSLGQLLGIEKLPTNDFLRTEHNRLLVVSWHGSRVVFPADEVHGAVRFHPENLRPLPATITRSSRSYLQGMLLWQNRSMGLIDGDVLFAALNRNLS